MSYLELAKQATKRKPAPEKALAPADVAPCGSPHCAGCYSVGAVAGRERFIHPPKVSAEWKAWLEKWQPGGKPQ